MRKKIWFYLIVLMFLYSNSVLAQFLAEKSFTTPIEHVVLIIKENRSFDHYFGKMKGVDGATKAKLSDGREIELKKAAKDIDGEKVKTGWYASTTAVNNGAMDGFDRVEGMGMDETFCQYDSIDMPNYYIYANNYGICDKFFGSTHGSSFGGHLYMVTGHSAGAVGNPEDPNANFINSYLNYIYPWGWAAPNNITVAKLYNDERVTPHFDFETIVDKVKNRGLTWREFCPVLRWTFPMRAEYKYSAFGTIKHIYESSEFNTNVHNLDQFKNVLGSEGLANYTIFSNTLSIPQAYQSLVEIFLESGTVLPYNSEHPPLGVCEGEDFTVDIINTIMASEYWEKTAIFVFWDSYGGFYDHVPPPQIDEYGLGIRVPCLIVSPYVKKGVHSTVFEPASINKFIKTIFDTDGFLSSRDSLANDIISCFDFNQTPLPKTFLPLRCTAVNNVNQPQGVQELPDKIILSQNFPNPFNSTTTIDFVLPKAGNVTLKVYDLMGREVATIINNAFLQSGNYNIRFEPQNLASGTYIYRIISDDFAEEKKMVLLK